VTYARSERVGNGWSTAIVWGNSEEKNILNAIVGSLTVGRTNRLNYEDNGWLRHIVALTLDFSKQYRDNDGAATKNSSSPQGQETDQTTENSSGTGFFVDNIGSIITNAHVVEGCANITANGAQAWVLSKNSDFDLALLKVRKPTGSVGLRTFPRDLPD
jgi:S1-C subfamily serine protease